MYTIRKAFQNSPLLAALTMFIGGVSFALAIIGLANPELIATVIQILLVIAMSMGVLYIFVDRRARASAAPFVMPRWVIGVQVTINMSSNHPQTHRPAWAA